LSISKHLTPVHNPSFFPNAKIQATRHLTPKFQIPFRISAENGSAVPAQSTNQTSPHFKSSPNCLVRGILPQFPLIELDLPLALQLPSKMLKNDVRCGKIVLDKGDHTHPSLVPGALQGIHFKIMLFYQIFST
jgi:hypothetical protein